MIPERNPYNNWSGNGSSTTFDFDFYIENSSQLAVYYTNSKKEQTLLTYGTDYSINEVQNPNGSFITYPLAGSSHSTLATGEVISLCLNLPVSQSEEYSKSSYLNLETLEYSLDYLTRLIQIVKRELARAVKVQEGSDIDTDELAASMRTVAVNSDNVNTVADNISNVNTVSSNISNINTVAGNISDVTNVSDNLTKIDDASSYIDVVNNNLSSKANTDLSNLSATGSNKFNTKSDKLIQNKQTVTDGAIVLDYGYSYYEANISGATTFTISTSGLTGLTSSQVITFELGINMPTVYSLTFPNGLKWQDDEAPDFDETGSYYLTLRSPDGGTNWLASSSSEGVWS